MFLPHSHRYIINVSSSTTSNATAAATTFSTPFSRGDGTSPAAAVALYSVGTVPARGRSLVESRAASIFQPAERLPVILSSKRAARGE
jgi:hypothetical protein